MGNRPVQPDDVLCISRIDETLSKLERQMHDCRMFLAQEWIDFTPKDKNEPETGFSELWFQFQKCTQLVFQISLIYIHAHSI